MTDAQQLPALSHYARAAARQVTHAIRPLEELTIRWAAEAETFEESNPPRHTYVSAWAQRCATFTIQSATR